MNKGLARAAAAGRRRGQRGVSLLEVLIAIVVLALGLLGILVVQMRTLADTQTSVRRAQAIRLIEDLSERIRANPNALNPDVLSQYVVDWGEAGSPGACAEAGAVCAPADLAAEQINAWKQSVMQNLPSGDAMTFRVPGNGLQLGVLVSWRQNERDTADDYVSFFSNTAQATNVTGASCPDNSICHLQFISVIGRCLVDAPSGATLVLCPGGIATLPPANDPE